MHVFIKLVILFAAAEMELCLNVESVKPSPDKQPISTTVMGEEISWDLTFHMNNRLSKVESEYHIQLESVLNPVKTISFDMITDEMTSRIKMFGPFPLNKMVVAVMPTCASFDLKITLDAGEVSEQSKIQERRVSTKKCLNVFFLNMLTGSYHEIVTDHA
jgi:hypothetical protein